MSLIHNSNDPTINKLENFTNDLIFGTASLFLAILWVITDSSWLFFTLAVFSSYFILVGYNQKFLQSKIVYGLHSLPIIMLFWIATLSTETNEINLLWVLSPIYLILFVVLLYLRKEEKLILNWVPFSLVLSIGLFTLFSRYFLFWI